MNIVDEKVINVLHGLIEICKDSEQGFKTAAAAEEARAGDLQQFILGCAAVRGEYIAELRAQVFTLGGNTEKSGSVVGSLHRGWMNIKSALASGDPSAVLAECARGEDAAIRAYRDALKAELDPETRAIVSRQARSVQADHDWIARLTDSVAYAKA